MQQTQNVTINESVAVRITSSINVQDDVQTFTYVAPATGQSSFGGFGGFYFGESFFASAPNLVRQENESVNVSSLALLIMSQSISVNENVTLLVPVLFVTVVEDVFLSESAFVIEPIVGTFYVIVQESIDTTDSPTLLITQLFLSVNDSIFLAENKQLSIVSHIAVSDSVVAAESVAMSPENRISASDNVSITENKTLSLESYVQAEDSVQINESTTVLLADLLVSTTENISLVDNTMVNITTYLPRMALLGVG